MNRTALPSESLVQADAPNASFLGPLPMEGTPLLRPSWSIIILAWFVRLSAGLNLFFALTHRDPKVIGWLGPWSPFEIAGGRHIRMLLMAILLFILASGLVRGKRTAWLCTIGVLALAPFLHFGSAIIWPQILINLGLIAFLFGHRRYFVARSDGRAVRSAIVICSVLAVALLLFGSIRLHDLRFETSGSDNWRACIQTALELVLVQNSHTQAAETLRSLNFFSILRIGGTAIGLLGLFLLLRPVLLRRRVREEDREKARRLVDQYGKDSFNPYAMLVDKSYFFTADGRAVVPYALSRNMAVVLADPIGPPAQRARAISEFALFCRHQDWEPVFYQVSDELSHYYEQAGFSLFKIGEEARLQADQFVLKGRDYQNLRTACNTARKLNLSFRWYDAAAGVDETLERRLAELSQQWLKGKTTREMTFDMGSFSLDDIRRYGAAIALDSDARPLAFATWRPFAQGTGRSLDLMRSLPKGRNVMDFVLVESILHFRTQGTNDISLGNAPLANVKTGNSQVKAEDTAVQFLFENLNRIYGYKSLFEFKRKYRPQWQGRYVAYRRGAHLPLVGLALVRVHAPGGIWKFFTS
jgi:phosphatidylglycerol lysyltransferase